MHFRNLHNLEIALHNLEIAIRILRIWKLCVNLEIAQPILRLRNLFAQLRDCASAIHECNRLMG